MIKREIYLNRIRTFYNDDLIKVITGVSWSGKSFLTNQIADELLEYKNKQLCAFISK